jgi:shikimate dehydrogenase
MQRFEMIGSPLAHVRTPGLLNAMLEARGDERRMRLKELLPRELPAYAKAAKRAGEVAGLVVTTPLKQAIAAELDRRTPLVALTGSCNCVRAEAGRWIGANFDGFGFSRALRRAGIGIAGRRVLLKGCGGAGRAIAARIVDEGAAALVIDDPEAAKTAAFVARLQARAPACTISAGIDSRGRFDLAVNASPLGMVADNPSPVPDEVVAQCAAVVDIVITATESRLAALARAHGKPLVAGSAMVEGQVELLLGFLLGPATSEEAVLPADAAVGSLA